MTGLAVCHSGAGTEAGSGLCYIKFGASTSGRRSRAGFQPIARRLRRNGFVTELVEPRRRSQHGPRHEAYREMLARGFRTDRLGVAMGKPNEAGYNRPGVYLIDDWR